MPVSSHKNIFLGLVLAASLSIAAFYIQGAFIHWINSVPETPFDQTALPDPPNYQDPEYWAALPNRPDSADWVPAGSGYLDKQAVAPIDVFFVHPTAAFYGDSWVAGFDNWLHIAAVDYGIIPQHVSAFNAIARIYAPRYRSVRMPVWRAEDKVSVAKAVDLAYSDVRQAFEYYLEYHNPPIAGKRRPFMLVSHSQGTLHTIRLIRELIDNQELSKDFVAGYLIGNTIPDAPWFQHTPLCQTAEQTQCYVTWNTMLDGGNPYHWIAEKNLSHIDCVNPLSWKADTLAIDPSQNPGSLPMIDYHALLKELPPLDTQLVGARCGEEGALWINEKPDKTGYSRALFEGNSYHTYDINLYYSSIRENAKLRAKEFLKDR